MEAVAVEGDDAGGLLAAMLQRMQPKRGQGGGVGLSEDAEDAALLAQPVPARSTPASLDRICGAVRIIALAPERMERSC